MACATQNPVSAKPLFVDSIPTRTFRQDTPDTSARRARALRALAALPFETGSADVLVRDTTHANTPRKKRRFRVDSPWTGVY
jgi:hypothetical protein